MTTMHRWLADEQHEFHGCETILSVMSDAAER